MHWYQQRSLSVQLKLPLRLFKFVLTVWLLTIFPGYVYADLDVSAKNYTWDGKIFLLPLLISDNSGVLRNNWPVHAGVPLPSGLVFDTDQLSLTYVDGTQIPCQFSVLSTYKPKDDSIKWVLLDFQMTLEPLKNRVVYLSNRSGKLTAKNKLVQLETEKVIRISTGPLQADISKTNACLFQTVKLNGRSIIQASSSDGPWIKLGAVDSYERFQGEKWSYNGWPKKKSIEAVTAAKIISRGQLKQAADVFVETNGPLRAVVVIKGKYIPESPENRDIKGYYNFTIRLHFYKGHSFVKVEHSIENSDTQIPLWNHMFRESGISHSLTLEKDTVVTGGGLDKLRKRSIVSFPGLKDGLAVLDQFSVKQGQLNPDGHPLGFKLDFKSENNREETVLTGDAARFLDISDSEKAVAISILYMVQEAPRSIFMSRNKMDILMNSDLVSGNEDKLSDMKLPAYDLDFGERIISDMLYYFHEPMSDMNKILDVSEAFQYPLFAYAPRQWYADTGVWYFEVSREPIRHSKKNDHSMHWQSGQSGYKDHGSNYGYNSGGHHESLNSGWLNFIKTGDLLEFEKNIALSRWSISHNPGWVYLNNQLHFGQAKDRYAALDRQFATLHSFSGFGKKDFYLWQCKDPQRVGTTYLNRFKWLPDIEHYALFRLFEYYYLTGDKRALDSINGFVNWDLYVQHYYMFKTKMQPLSQTDYFIKHPNFLKRGHSSSRGLAWMLYTNLAGLHATASSVYNEFACWQIRRMLGLLRHRHGQLKNWWEKPQEIPEEDRPGYLSTTQTWQEAIGVLALHEAYKTYGDERILDGIWALADYFAHHVLFYPGLGMVNKWTSMPNMPLGVNPKKTKSVFPQRHDRHVQMWPILYHYTGWPEIRERFMRFEDQRKDTWIKDWFLQTIGWQTQNAPKISCFAPKPITDLKVISNGKQGITLTWTSPKDDGATGRASKYFVKYSDKPIVEFAPTDNPDRTIKKEKIVAEIENYVLQKYDKIQLARMKQIQIKDKVVNRENVDIPKWDPSWYRQNAFWMAEHVAGEPEPKPAGQKEVFTITHLMPHNWFGLSQNPGIEVLEPGIYYFAICSLDDDFNLSKPSNVVQVRIK